MSVEKDTILKAKAGDYSAFEEIVKAYSDKLFGILLRLTSNLHDAEDALQETFIRVFKGLKRLRSVDSFDLWIIRIAVNVARSLVRKRSPPYVQIEDVEELVGDMVEPFHNMDREELKNALEIAVASLPVELKEAFILRDIEGMKVKEISEILGISESLVKVRAHRARLLLRKKLSEYRGMH